MTSFKTVERITLQTVAPKRVRLSFYFDDGQDNHYAEFEIGHNRPSMSHQLRQLADLIDRGASAEELELLHSKFADKMAHDRAETVTYCRSRLDALDLDAHLLRTQRAERRHGLSGRIKTEVARLRWAVAKLEDATP